MNRLLIPLLLACAIGAGEGTEEAAPAEITVPLEPATASEALRIGYPGARSHALEHTAPRFLFEVPHLAAKDPLFFRMALGETKGVPYFGALDRSPDSKTFDLLYLDKNRDLDLTNDGDPIKGRIRTLWNTDEILVEFLDVHLSLPYELEAKEFSEPFVCVLYYIAKNNDSPKTIQVERDGWRQGVVEIDGVKHVVALVDDDSDGIYTLGDSWVVREQTDDMADLLTRDSMRSMRFLSWSKDEKQTVDATSVDPAGRSVKLRISPAKETEHEYFLRIARQRQTDEEKTLKLDPLRPKADDDKAVDWITGKDVAWAIAIGASPNVKKRILVEFAGNGQWDARMQTYTFRDREVVELCRRFVCAKVPFAKDVGDSKKYVVMGTPTYLILDTDGSELARQEGFARPTEFAAWLKSSLR